MSFCPFPSPASSLAPREKQGPSFLLKLPKSSAMYYVDTNKIEETMTSSRLSPVRSDKRGRSAPSFSAPCRLLFVFSTPSRPGPSRVGEMQTNYSNRNLTRVDREVFSGSPPKLRYYTAPSSAGAVSPPFVPPPTPTPCHSKNFALHPVEYFQALISNSV